MKLWLTAPYDPNGIEEIDTVQGPDNCGCFRYLKKGLIWQSSNWFREGFSFHRTREAAVEKAREHRAKWLRERAAELTMVASLPEIN